MPAVLPGGRRRIENAIKKVVNHENAEPLENSLPARKPNARRRSFPNAVS
jgi:hypothetical protein